MLLGGFQVGNGLLRRFQRSSCRRHCPQGRVGRASGVNDPVSENGPAIFIIGGGNRRIFVAVIIVIKRRGARHHSVVIVGIRCDAFNFAVFRTR